MGRLQILTAVGVRGVSMCVAPSLMFSTENYCPLKTDYEVLADCTVELTGYGCGQSKVPNLSFTKEGRPVKKPKNLSNQDDEPLNCASDDWSECEQLSLDEKISPTTDTPSTPSLISVPSLASMVWDYEYDLKDNKSLISSNSGSSELENHLSRSGLENGGSSPDYTTELLRSSSQSSSSSSKGRNLKATVENSSFRVKSSTQKTSSEPYLFSDMDSIQIESNRSGFSSPSARSGCSSTSNWASDIDIQYGPIEEYGAASRTSTAPEHEEDKLDGKSPTGSISGLSEFTNGLFRATVGNSSFRVKSLKQTTSETQNESYYRGNYSIRVKPATRGKLLRPCLFRRQVTVPSERSRSSSVPNVM